ncbi:hypothetical protein HYS10_00475, partial [Candidatus Collierbacteria bacterium]|nr:hypothetical protein [Candidatus Collierbacteria bacterium]
MKQKLKDIFLFLRVFNLPFQLGKHFWLSQSFVKGFRIDYLSPTFYLTDLFIIFFLFLNLNKLRQILSSLLTSLNGISFVILLFLNLWAANFNLVTSLAWLRLTVYLLLFLVLKQTPNLIKKIKLPLILS